jgi:methyl-accepting chemotaxis protein
VKNLSIRVKLATAFLLLSAITLFVGGLAVWNMVTVQSDAARMVKQYVPEWKGAGKIESWQREVGYHMVAYSLNHDPAWLAKAKTALENLRSSVAAVDDLAANSGDLPQLAGAVDELKHALQTYEDTIRHSEEVTLDLLVARQQCLQSDAILTKCVSEYLDAQRMAILAQIEGRAGAVQKGASANAVNSAEELKIRQQRINEAADILSTVVKIRADLWQVSAENRSGSTRTRELVPQMELVKDRVNRLLQVTRQATNKRQLQTALDESSKHLQAVQHMAAAQDHVVQIAADRLKAYKRTLELATALDQAASADTDAAAQRSQQRLGMASRVTLGTELAGFLVSVLLAVLLCRSIQKTLNGLIGEAQRLTSAAVEGKLQTRGNTEVVSGEFRPIITGFNATLDAVIGPLHVAADYIERIARGDIPAKITESYQGDFDQIKQNLNQCIDAVNAMSSDATMLCKAAVEGRLDARADATSHLGDFCKIIQGVNDTLDAVIGPLNVAAEHVDRISQGDIPPEITETYQGDFNTIKDNLNCCIGALSGLIAEMKRMAEEHNAGDIDVFIPADQFQGVYRTLAEEINSMVVGHIAVNRSAMACVDEFGKGNFDAALERFPGKKAFINDTVERVRENLQGVAAETGRLAQAAADGQLEIRASVDKYHGHWRQIIGGMNRMIEGVAMPLRHIEQALGRMAAKDFTQAIETHYPGAYGRLRDNVNLLVDSLRGALGQIRESADQFSEGARVVAESSQSLASGAQEQSASVEEMTASIEELARSVESVKENAVNADQVAKQTSGLAVQGGQAVQKSIEAMELIRASATQIGEIIQVISEIAGQTNLLALNAAIEAARAGEHGMGFAVVADEVRKLAERSNQAAREISGLIKQSTQRVEEGAQLSAATGRSLQDIIGGVETTAGRIAQIATSAIQQAANAKEVSHAIQSVSAVTERAAAGSEELASSSEELGAQAAAVRELLGQFSIRETRG